MVISRRLRTLLLIGIALLVPSTATAQQPERPLSEEYLSLKRDLIEAFQRPLPELSIREIIALFSLLEEFQQVVWQEEGIRGWERIGHTSPDVLQNGIILLVYGTHPETTRKLMETRASALFQQQEVKYRMVATGIECIKKDVPPVVTEYLLASYYGGAASHKYPDNEARPVDALRELLQRTPLSQLDFPALAEIFFDLEVIHRKEGKEALDELAVLVDNDPLLLGSFYLEMPSDQSQQVLEERMNELLWAQSLRYRMATEGLLAVFSFPDSSGVLRSPGWLSVRHRLWWFYLTEKYAPIAFRCGLVVLVLGLIGTTSYALRKRRDLRRAERDLMQEMEKELQTAHELQMSLMPKAPPRTAGFDLAGRCLPANHVGGDLFQYYPLALIA